MGAILSQAVANQLRQFPQSQDPRPSPPTLIQQVLNQPGPSMPTWMAPVMERQQLLALNTPEAFQAATADALRMAMAFGGADITKEQRAAWEAENRAARLIPGADDIYKPGTRVMIRPRNEMELYTKYGSTPGDEGTIVDPRDPKSPEGKRLVFAQGDMGLRRDTPPLDHVAVTYPGSKWWFWRNRDDLEILRPLEEFPTGTKVSYTSPTGAIKYEGFITDPPPQSHQPHRPSPGRDYVWVDVHAGTPSNKPGEQPYEGIQKYSTSETWGAWFHRKDLEKIPKKGK